MQTNIHHLWCIPANITYGERIEKLLKTLLRFQQLSNTY